MSQKKKPFEQARYAFKQAMGDKKLEKVKFRWKHSLVLIALGILAYVILRVVLEIGPRYSFVIWFIYEGIAAVAVIAYVIIVRGNLSSKPITEDMLPEEWSFKEKADYLALDKVRREKGKKFLYIALPFIIAVMMGILSEIWWPMVSDMFL